MFAGDGAGVGKGRTIAGIIFENFLKGRKKAIWVSVSNDLKYDSERDLNDIGASKIDVYPLSKVGINSLLLLNRVILSFCCMHSKIASIFFSLNTLK